MKRLYAAVIGLSLIWGSSFFFIKVLLSHYHPASIAFFRCLFGWVTITLIMLVLRKPFHLHKIPWKPMVIVGLLQTSVPWYFLGLSETRLPSSVASVLNATTPLWTIIIGYRWFNRKVHRNQWLGLVFGFCGILILLDFHPEHFFSVDSFGVFAMLIVTFCYGYSAQVSKRDLSDLTLYQSVFGTMLIGCLSSGLFAISFEPITLRSLLTQPSVLFSFFMLGSMGSAIGYILFYYMVQKGSAEFSTMVTYLVPVTAMIWGYLFLGESIHWTLLLGFLLILLGVFLSNRKPKLTEKKISENPSIKL